MPIDNSTRFPKPLAADLRELSEGMAIVIDGDTAPKAIASGQYLFTKNHSTLATGGYHATAAIASGADITSSNVAADADGIVNGSFSSLYEHIAKCHYYNTTITSKVHTSDGALYRSSGKSITINSSNVAYASISVVNSTHDCWACIVSITGNKITFVIESVDDIDTDESFTIYVMTVDE